MPRTEARIFTSIWRDPQFAGIDQSAQWLYFFLLSQDDLSYSGVMPLRVRRWVPKAAGLTVADLEGALKTLEASPRRFVITDEDTGELFVRSLLRRDGIWKQPNLLKLARESAEQLESPRLRAELLAELRRLPLDETASAQVRTLVAEFIQDLEVGTPHPTAYPPEHPGEYLTDDPPDEGTDDPPADPTAKDYACAEGNGEGYSPIEGPPRSPGPVTPKTTTAQERRRGTRIPDDFAVSAEMVVWFRQHCPHVDGKTETDAFIDYWRGRSGREGCKLDWPATWRNWMRGEEKKAGPRNRSRPSEPVSTTDQRVAQAEALKERRRRRDNPQPQNVIPGSVLE